MNTQSKTKINQDRSTQAIHIKPVDQAKVVEPNRQNKKRKSKPRRRPSNQSSAKPHQSGPQPAPTHREGPAAPAKSNQLKQKPEPSTVAMPSHKVLPLEPTPAHQKGQANSAKPDQAKFKPKQNALHEPSESALPLGLALRKTQSQTVDSVHSVGNTLQQIRMPSMVPDSSKRAFVQGQQISEPESETLDYKGLHLRPDHDLAKKLEPLRKHLLAFINRGEGSLLLGIDEKHNGRNGRFWVVAGFGKIYLDKVMNWISTTARGFIPVNEAMKNLKMVYHPVLKTTDQDIEDRVVLEIKFERNPHAKFEVFLDSKDFSFSMREHAESIRHQDGIVQVFDHYMKKLAQPNNESAAEAFRQILRQLPLGYRKPPASAKVNMQTQLLYYICAKLIQ